MLLFGCSKVSDKSRDKSQAPAATAWGGNPGSSLANMTYGKPQSLLCSPDGSARELTPETHRLAAGR